MAKYDLTDKLARYMDRHLVHPLLEFLSNKELYPTDQILAAKYDLLSKTSMVDFANEIYKTLHKTDKNAPDHDKKRANVLKSIADLEGPVQEFTDLLSNPEIVQQFKQDKMENIEILKQYGFKPETLAALYNYALLQYQIGDYTGAAEMLLNFRVFSNDDELNVSALWGKLAAEILVQNWESAWDDLKKLQEIIDNKAFTTSAEELINRAWLIHWSLFVFFNHPKGRDGIVDLFFQPQYITTISKECPWILRYLCTAVVTNKRRRNMMKELVKVIEIDSYYYRDPVTEFVESLYIKMDFEGAQKKLKECEEVLLNDFFLVATRDDFMESARLFVFENYCRIHQCIDIRGLSEKLNLTPEEGEKWLVNLIRNARLDAKIDTQTNTIMMGNNLFSTSHGGQSSDAKAAPLVGAQGIYQSVIEKTKGLNFRTTVLMSSIEKRENDKRRNNNNNNNNKDNNNVSNANNTTNTTTTANSTTNPIAVNSSSNNQQRRGN